MPSVADARQHLSGIEEFRQCLSEQLQHTRHSIHILSHSLDSRLFGLDNISTLLTDISRNAGKRTNIRILIKDKAPLINTAHPLTQIHRRLPSIINIRQLLTPPTNEQMCYIISDEAALLFQHEENVFTGFFDPDARAEVRRLLDEHGRLWERQSVAIAELRQLAL